MTYCRARGVGDIREARVWRGTSRDGGPTAKGGNSDTPEPPTVLPHRVRSSLTYFGSRKLDLRIWEQKIRTPMNSASHKSARVWKRYT